jgi:hypothetical protein
VGVAVSGRVGIVVSVWHILKLAMRRQQLCLVEISLG